MKTFPTLLLACALAIPAFAEEKAPAKATPASTAKPDTPVASAAAVAPTISVTKSELTAPLVLKDGAISQPSQTELAGGGKAIFKFTVAKAGNYVIQAVVNAPDEDSNSFFLNIDAQPEDPLMIWDVNVTKGFEERIVSWRGNGDSGSDEFAPKRFTLTAGEHQLIIVGREPAQLKSVSIRPASN